MAVKWTGEVKIKDEVYYYIGEKLFETKILFCLNSLKEDWTDG